MTVSLFDRHGLAAVRKELQLDSHVVKRLRNDVCKNFVSDHIALSRFAGRERIQLHALGLFHRSDSKVDGASKLLFETEEGLLIEAVILRVASGRTSLCVSSQVGCAAACRFCATGKMGIVRNLSSQEILDQVVISGQVLASENRKIRNVVFMGMGEPFHNEASLFESLEFLMSSEFFHISPSKILVSTVGVIDGMLRCAQRFPAVNLALSLHSVRQDVRERLIPIARRYPIDLLKDAVRSINATTSRKVMIEYLMLDGVNDSSLDAREVIEWTSGLKIHVNLIPYNPIDDAPGLKGSSRNTLDQFASVLKQAGLTTTVRYSLGQNISAACGQLVQHENRRPTVTNRDCVT